MQRRMQINRGLIQLGSVRKEECKFTQLGVQFKKTLSQSQRGTYVGMNQFKKIWVSLEEECM